MAPRRGSAGEEVVGRHYRNNSALAATALVCGALAGATLLGGCAAPSGTGAGSSSPEATQTVAPTPLRADQLYVMDGHEQALPFWTAKGVRGAVLVHVDAHDDFRAIDEVRLAPVLSAVRSKDATAVAKLADNDGLGGSYNLGDYVYAAVKAGVVREVVWVVPEHKGPETLKAWREWLEEQRFPTADIASFSARDKGGVFGTLHGVPFTIVTPVEFAPPAEPVLLDIDTDFFPVYSAVHSQTNPLGPTHDVLSGLLGSGMRISYGTVASSVSGDYLDLKYKWLADVAAAALVRPELLSAEAPPAEWGAMGEAAALEGVDDAVAADRFREAIAMSPQYAAAWYGLGRALLSTGDENEAIDAMSRADEIDPLYANGWLQTASELSLKGDKRALGFVERAQGKVSRFAYELRRADILYNLKRFKEAATAYEKLSRRYDHPDIWMYLGDSYVALKQNGKAEQAYLRGMASLEKATFRSPGDYVDALPTLGRLAEQDGQPQRAREYYEIYLERSPEGVDAEEVSQRLGRLSD